MKSGIYQIVCKTTNKRYIGSSVNITKRWSQHRRDLKSNRHPSRAMQAEWSEHGEKAFIFELLWQVEPVRECLLYEEQIALNHLSCEYNTLTIVGAPRGSLRGYAGRRHSAETKEKIRAANLGKTASDASRQRMSESKKGKKMNLSDEDRARWVALRMGRGKGYSYNKRDKRWRAYTTVDGKQKSLGYFRTEEEAAACAAPYRATP